MKGPPEFYELAQAFYQGSRSDVKDEREWIASALRHLDHASKRAIKQYLIDLLSANPSEIELQKLWNDAGSSYYIVGKAGKQGVRAFLTTIRDQIE